MIRRLLFWVLSLLSGGCLTLKAQQAEGYKLVWSDEFNSKGRPDSTKWSYEKGFVRNEEFQWYQPENASCRNGRLVIEAKREVRPNPGYISDSRDWRKKRPEAHYTSACLLTRGKGQWLYGRFEMRARIDVSPGMWPAWWTLGISKRWPGNGEVDIMEYYRRKLLANIACLGKDGRAEWFSHTFPVDSLGKHWSAKFHTWRMDWTEQGIALYVDGRLLNAIPLDSLENKDGSGFNPFRQPHYMLLNLAIGGQNGGDPEKTSFPRRFEIDYVRVYQKEQSLSADGQNKDEERKLWLGFLDRIARPVLSNLAQDRLKENMPVELSKTTDNKDNRTQSSYLEAFGRTLSGIAPWLDLEGGSAEEISLRAKYRQWALQGIANATDPRAKDYMKWSGGQPLVDAAFFALGLLRCPWLWEHLDSTVKQQVVMALKTARMTVPVYSNWLLFPAMIEAFFCQYGYGYDAIRIDYAVREFAMHWYIGDGTFSDGMEYHDDYYNSYVIQPFLATILAVVNKKGHGYAWFTGRLDRINKRYAEIQERMINMDGTFPVTGRSITYRTGAFHHLADMAWRHELPGSLPPAQVRCGLTAVIKKTFGSPQTYTKNGWLNVGLYGYQPALADFYITTGSLYLCSEIFLPLGLPQTDAFWAAPPMPWTAVKVWSGQDSTSADHALEIRP